MAQSDVREIDNEGKEKPKRRFDQRDWDYIAQFVMDSYATRKNDRKDREKCWDDIDRQIRMEPETSFKYIVKDGTRILDHKKAWMAETELPLQAQALEVLTADARRMFFPDSGPWFRAHAETTDAYLDKIDFQSLILGDELEVPSRITQDNADKLVEGFLTHLFLQIIRDEDFYTRQDRINAGSLKYGMGIGRARVENKSLYIKTPRGVRREQRKVPILMPCSIRNLYLDDPQPTVHSAQTFEPAHIWCDHLKLENLQIAASRGSNDPDDPDGGWMPQNVKKIEPDDKGFVTVLEMEGDIVVPRKTTRSMFIPGAIVTVVMGGKDKGGNVTNAVIRFRFRKYPWSSYVLFPYHYEDANDQYPTSPLMKGRPVQIAATDATNRFLDSAMLKCLPPVGWDRTDTVFGQNGGPSIFPGAQWGTTDDVNVHDDVGGDPSALLAAAAQFTSLYAELTGVLPGRLGAQTVSHTTAFAKDAELTRGAVRTVDYVRSSGQGPMNRWLSMAYTMGRDALGSRENISFFIDAYGGYVEITKDFLPERASFEWFGAGGPAEEAQRRQMRVQSAGLAMQIDQAGLPLGLPPRINKDAMVDQILREGGWTDIDAVVNQPKPMGMPTAPAGPPALITAAAAE